MLMSSIAQLKDAIARAHRHLAWCRMEGDALTIDLAEAGLNHLLEQFSAKLKERDGS